MIRNIYFILLFFTLCIQSEDKWFVFVIPSYNNASQFYNGKTLIEMNLESIFNQTYENYNIIFCDDASSDKTYEVVNECCERFNKKHKLTYIKNETNQKAPYNIYNSIHMYCPDNAVLIILDGDDWLTPRPDILNILNDIYQDPNVWMTYGEFLVLSSPDGSHDTREYLYEDAVNNTYRYTYYYFLPLRTFYAKLFKHIKISDYLYNYQFYQSAGDLQTGISLLELAGTHAYYINIPFYVYNNILPTNDNALNPKKQMFFDFYLRNTKQYRPLASLFDTQKDPFVYDHITFVSSTISDTDLSKQCEDISKIAPINNSLICLSEYNNDLKVQFRNNNNNNNTKTIPNSSLYSWISYENMLDIKTNMLEFIKTSRANYFVITETGQDLPNLDTFDISMITLSNIMIIGQALSYPKTLGLHLAHPNLCFVPLQHITSYLDIKKPALIIITREEFLKCLTSAGWTNGSFLSILALLEERLGNHYATFLPIKF